MTQPRINDVEEMLENNLPCSKKALHEATFSLVLFGQNVWFIDKIYLPYSVYISQSKRVMDLLMMSTSDCTSAKNTDAGRDAK